MAAWPQANAVALLGQFLTLVGLIVGALTVVWQLGRQHKSSLALQREVALGHFRTNFVIRRRRLKIMQRFDASAHEIIYRGLCR